MATKKKAEEAKMTAKKIEAEVKEAPKAAKKAAEKVEKEVKKVEKEVKETVKKAEKETKAKAKTAKKAAEKALIATTVKGLFFEYGDKQIDASALAELAKEAFKANGGKGAVRTMELYVKAEDNALYYVINGKESGKVEL